MVDSVLFTEGTGTKIATEKLATEERVQLIKLLDGTAASVDPIR